MKNLTITIAKLGSNLTISTPVATLTIHQHNLMQSVEFLDALVSKLGEDFNLKSDYKQSIIMINEVLSTYEGDFSSKMVFDENGKCLMSMEGEVTMDLIKYFNIIKQYC